MIDNKKECDKSKKSIQRPNLLSSRKKNVSCLNIDTILSEKKHNLEYKISYYHPGTYFLFNTFKLKIIMCPINYKYFYQYFFI